MKNRLQDPPKDKREILLEKKRKLEAELKELARVDQAEARKENNRESILIGIAVKDNMDAGTLIDRDTVEEALKRTFAKGTDSERNFLKKRGWNV